MARKFFRGTNAGYIGKDKDGKLIYDHFLIKMETAKRSRFFHVFEYRAIKVGSIWLEIKPTTKVVWNENEGGWDSIIVWKFENKEILPEDLEIRYEIVEITDLITEVNKLYLSEGLVRSPYVDINKLLEIYHITDEMNKKNLEDKVVIEAIEQYIKKRIKRKKNK